MIVVISSITTYDGFFFFASLFFFFCCHFHGAFICKFSSQQPEHLLDDFESATKKLGLDRAQKGSYLFRSLLTSKAQLAFGSDWPVSTAILFGYYFIVMPIRANKFVEVDKNLCNILFYTYRSLLCSQVANINPLGGIRTAMKRIPPTSNDAWIPSECLSVDDALKA